MIDVDRSTWKRVRFADVVESVTDRVDDPSAAGVDRYVGLEHLDPGSLTIARWGSPSDVEATKLRFRSGDVVFARRRAYQRKLGAADFEGIASAHSLVLRAKPGQLLPAFLPVFLSSDLFMNRAIQISVGSLSPTVNWKTLAIQEFELPPLDEQGRIADLLWAVEGERRALGASADALAGARDAKVREELDRHADWPRLPLASVLAEPVRNGISAPESSEPSAVPTISISAVRGGSIAVASNLKYMKLDAAKAKPFELCVGDFLVTRGNGNKRLVGAGGLLSEVPPEGCVYPDLLIRLRPNAERLVSEFLSVVWNERTVHARLLRRAKSTNGIWKVNGRDVSRHEIPVPPIAEQERILSDLQLFEDAANGLESLSARASHLHRAISRELFS